MKIAIVGWGVEAKSAFMYYGPDHEYLIVNETHQDDFPPESEKVKIRYLNEAKPVGITGQVKDFSYLEGIENYDKIIYSVTAAKNLETLFPDDHPFWQKALTVQHIFFQEVKTKNIIGVTGTKGKGTTSTLIYKMLEAAGKKVFLGGNIGIGVLDFVHDVGPEDWVVLELSNFQLYRFPYSPHVAVCLMVISEHQDWHPDLDDYAQAKGNIFRHQQPQDIAIYYPANEISSQLAALSPGKKIPYLQKPGAYVRGDGMIVIGDPETELMDKAYIRLLGEHNVQNVCAAITAAWQATQDQEAIKKVVSTFSGLEHRLEFVREVDGVQYYDDSFGTTPDTAIVAMKAFKQPKVMILGGSDKGASFERLVEEVLKNNVKHVITIGNTGPAIAELLRIKGYTHITSGLQTMPEIVDKAKGLANNGDIVLLSTGCASFGMFRDYKDRGEQFKRAVQELVPIEL